MKRMTWLVLLAAAMLTAAASGSARGADLPERDHQDPGRLSARRHRPTSSRATSARSWRRPGTATVIVENRAGANGALAAAQLAKVPPDGQTLMMIVSGHITNPLVMANAGYDALKDSTAISLLASSPLAIFAHPSFAANDIKGAIALAKEKPNTIGYATPGVGSIQQLSMELLSYLSGAKFLHVPYRGGAPALNDTIGGHVPISVLSVFQVLPLIQEGKLKALAVTDVKRTAVLPNVQTVAAAGVADYEASLLFGLIAPPGLPPAVLAKINAEVVRIINAPEMQKKLAAQGVVPRSPARQMHSWG